MYNSKEYHQISKYGGIRLSRSKRIIKDRHRSRNVKSRLRKATIELNTSVYKKSFQKHYSKIGASIISKETITETMYLISRPPYKERILIYFPFRNVLLSKLREKLN